MALQSALQVLDVCRHHCYYGAVIAQSAQTMLKAGEHIWIMPVNTYMVDVWVVCGWYNQHFLIKQQSNILDNTVKWIWFHRSVFMFSFELQCGKNPHRIDKYVYNHPNNLILDPFNQTDAKSIATERFARRWIDSGASAVSTTNLRMNQRVTRVTRTRNICRLINFCRLRSGFASVGVVFKWLSAFSLSVLRGACFVALFTLVCARSHQFCPTH